MCPPCMVKTQFVHQTAPVQGFQKAFFPSNLGKNQTCNIVCVRDHIEEEETPNVTHITAMRGIKS